MTTASDNIFPKVILDAVTSAPAAPSNDNWKLYAQADGLYARSSNTIVGPLGSGGSVGTGSAGAVYAMGNGVAIWNAGTSFPGSKATNDRYWRTDLDMEFYYDGTRWLSTQVFPLQMIPRAGTTSTTAVGDLSSTISATTSGIVRALAPSVLGASNIWLVDYKVAFQVGAGTALGASHKWVGLVVGVDSAGGSTGTVATVNIDSGSSSVWRETTVTIGSAQAAGTIFYLNGWTKTGTPGVLNTGEAMTYRIIAT